jgi:hypothetical protein
VVVRKAGEYAISGRDALPHLETGGPEGAVIMLSLQTESGILFEAFDPDFNKQFDFRIEDMVARWESRN